MVLVVKCLICNKELTYTKGNPSELITHLKFEHPSLRQKRNERKIGINTENSKEITMSQGINI
jgi:hypothetical protein